MRRTRPPRSRPGSGPTNGDRMTDSDPNGAEPGWYPSQSTPNTDAYWDGSTWTGHTRAVAGWYPSWSTPNTDAYWDGSTWTGHTRAAVARPSTRSTGRTIGIVALLVAIPLGFILGYGFLKPVASPLKPSASPLKPSASPLKPVASDQSPETKKEKCSRLESVAQYSADHGNKSFVGKTMKEAKDLGCKFPRPKLIEQEKAPSKAPSTGYALPVMDGIAYKWAENPDCDYFDCFGMTIRADTVSCPGGVYAEINLLDADGTVVDYGNDLVGSLVQGQKAKLIFNVTENSVKSARLNGFTCY